MNPKELNIGDIVKFSGLLTREFGYAGRREWKERTWASGYGYYVGIATKANGHYDYDPEWGGSFSPNEHITVARIRTHTRGKEEYALFESLEKVEGIDPDVEFRERYKWPEEAKKIASKESLSYKCPECGKFFSQYHEGAIWVSECKCGWYSKERQMR